MRIKLLKHLFLSCFVFAIGLGAIDFIFLNDFVSGIHRGILYGLVFTGLRWAVGDFKEDKKE